MKKFLPLLVFVVTLNSLGAQIPFNRAYHSINEKIIAQPVEIAGDIYFVTYNYEATGFGAQFLYKHGAGGQLIYRKALPLSFGASVVFKTLDDKLMIAGDNFVCDLAPQNLTHSIAKFDTSGNAVFQSTYTVKSWDRQVACIQRNDSGYFSFSDSLIISHDKNGAFQYKQNLGLTNISSAIQLQSGSFLVSAKSNGNNALVTLSQLASITAINQVPALFKKLVYFGAQNIMALAPNGGLFKFSPGLALTGQSNLGAGVLVNDFTVSNDTLYSLLTSGTIPSQYRVMDTVFSTIFSDTPGIAGFKQKALIVTGQNKVLILAEGLAQNTTPVPPPLVAHAFVSLNQRNKLAAYNFNSDVELRALTVDSAHVIIAPVSVAVPGLMKAIVRMRARAKVINKGTRVLTNFKLNFFLEPSHTCGDYYYQEEFSGYNLAPGDSVSVTGKFVARQFIPVTVGQTLQVQYCFYLSVPNNETDKVMQDNEACQNLSFVITNLKEQTIAGESIHIFPNPFSTRFVITSADGIRAYRVTNALGQEVVKVESEGLIDKAEVNLGEFKSGVYFVTLSTENGIITKKIIKQ